jgi:hypothetical protein
MMNSARRLMRRGADTAVGLGMPPSVMGYRVVREARLDDLHDQLADEGESVRVIHQSGSHDNPLPRNVDDRDTLPRDRGWWGYSFHDVPERKSEETLIARLPDCLIAPGIEPIKENFWPIVLNKDRRALALREMRFKPWHAETLRRKPQMRLPVATWVCERVFDNYSHWLTAHLPKLLLLKSEGLLADVLFPRERPAFIDDSLRMVGIDPTLFIPFEPGSPIHVDRLTVLSTDRFRRELLRLPSEACPIPIPESPDRRVYISRERAARRKLINEHELWPLLRDAGFEKVFMEDLTFDEQVSLMRQTSILAAPHGAGLTNMMFCPPGTHIVEIADLDFPNPNFYAVASAMRHRYWILNADGIGSVHPLEKDMRLDPAALKSVLESIEST